MKLTRELIREINHLLRPVAKMAMNSIARAVVSLVSDGGKMQLVQLKVMAGETVEGDKGVEHFQPYGFSSVPLAGAEAAVLFLSGSRDHPLVVAVSDRRHRPTGGEPGEVTVYNDKGARVTLLTNGDIEVAPGLGGKVRVGSADADTPPALSSELADLKSRIAAWVPTPNDGGASLKLVFAAWPVPGATKVDVE